jgi:hypothetical protein
LARLRKKKKKKKKKLKKIKKKLKKIKKKKKKKKKKKNPSITHRVDQRSEQPQTLVEWTARRPQRKCDETPFS